MSKMEDQIREQVYINIYRPFDEHVCNTIFDQTRDLVWCDIESKIWRHLSPPILEQLRNYINTVI